MHPAQQLPPMTPEVAAAFMAIAPMLIAELEAKVTRAPFFGIISIEAHFSNNNFVHAKVVTEQTKRGPTKGSAPNGGTSERQRSG